MALIILTALTQLSQRNFNCVSILAIITLSSAGRNQKATFVLTQKLYFLLFATVPQLDLPQRTRKDAWLSQTLEELLGKPVNCLTMIKCCHNH